MISDRDKKLLAEAGREYILDIALKSNFLKEELTFKEHLKLCDQVTKLSYEEVITLTITEDIRAFESKFKKFLKYSIAAIVGTSMIGSPPLGMFVPYMYRKATDTCERSCFTKMPLSKQRKICRYECQLDASKRLERELRSQIRKCGQFKYANRCEKKLQKEYIKWAKRTQKISVKLARAREDLDERRRNKRRKELLKRAKKLRAHTERPKDQLVKFIAENESLRKQLDFKKHLKLYQTSKYIKEQKDSEIKPVKIDPKKEKMIRTVMYLGLWAVPIPFFNDLINYMVKKYSIGCASKCASEKKLPKEVCYHQCTYLGAKYAVKTLKSQLPKCKKAKKPEKCTKKIYKMLEDWKQREVERKIKLDSAIRSSKRKAREKSLIAMQKQGRL
jgi:hypothetical protein